MREIKFRAWDTEEKEFYKPTHEAYKGNLHELLLSFSGDLLAHTLKGIRHESLFPDKYILMQYTGLSDKNGKDVYEGDVLYHKGVNYAVEWKNYKWRFRKANGKGHPFMQLFNHPENFAVIGNIYENHNLLDNNNYSGLKTDIKYYIPALKEIDESIGKEVEND